MNIRLVKPSEEHREEWYAIIKEMEDANEKITPLALKCNAENYDIFLKNARDIAEGKNLTEGFVSADIYFLVDFNGRILGAIDIRHELNEYLLNYGGNIGYGVRPSERKKGYATEMLRLALDICKKRKMDRVLVTCFKSNIGSAKTILKNGGSLENEILDGDELKQRYWIKMKLIQKGE